jgi:hypothetical protein
MSAQSDDTIEMSAMGSKSSRDSISFQHTRSRTQSDVEQNDGGALMNMIGRPQQMNVRSENPFQFAPTRFTAEQAVLKRNFGSLSILALSITLLASWESIAR